MVMNLAKWRHDIEQNDAKQCMISKVTLSRTVQKARNIVLCVVIMSAILQNVVAANFLLKKPKTSFLGRKIEAS
jgi:hypothetical protein